MAPDIVLSTFEVMVRRPSGELARPHYPGTGDPPKEFTTHEAAAYFIEQHWPTYHEYSVEGDPVIVVRS